MRAAAWALAPIAVCHAASVGLMTATVMFGLDNTISGAPEGLALVLPLCRGGTISMGSLGTIDLGAVWVHIAAMLAMAGALALSACVCDACFSRWGKSGSRVRRGPPRWLLFGTGSRRPARSETR